MKASFFLLSEALPLVRIPGRSAIYRLGSASAGPSSPPLIQLGDQTWIINRQADVAEGWAIVGDGEGRRNLALQDKHRIRPPIPPPGHFPYIASLAQSASAQSTDALQDLPRPVRHLAFARPPSTGEFTDFTARYGALHEEDRLSFRQTLSALHPTPKAEEVERVSRIMQIDHLLDLPSVSLSSGQTRRARIAAALLSRPILLLLEDPMAGLDIKSREEVSKILGDINQRGDVKIVLVLRGKGKGAMPGWVDRVCEVREGQVWLGSKEEWESKSTSLESTVPSPSSASHRAPAAHAEPVLQLQNVSITYGEGTRPVLKAISWTVKPGERWHLKGANGSGKTTLLSLILGHHPRSFSLPAASLQLFGKPRRLTPTPILRTLIGHTSPEIYASFPRGMGLSALEAVGSGFEGVFSRRQLDPAQKSRVLDLLARVEDLLVSARPGEQALSVEQLAGRNFAHFTPPQQALLLFLRAIVSRPPLLVLDEPSQGVDEIIWARCCAILSDEWQSMPQQAVIVVSHYNDEVPWNEGDGKILQLDQGYASIAQ